MKKQESQSPAKTRDVIKKIGDFLMRRHESIAVAESVTAGLVQHALASVENASLFFQGGITAYNVGQKSRHLHIDPIHGIASNCVSEKVAAEMAINTCELFKSDWGLAVTGYAAPVPESSDKLFAFIAVALHGKTLHSSRIIPPILPPSKVQQHYLSVLVNKALEAMRKASKNS